MHWLRFLCLAMIGLLVGCNGPAQVPVAPTVRITRELPPLHGGKTVNTPLQWDPVVYFPREMTLLNGLTFCHEAPLDHSRIDDHLRTYGAKPVKQGNADITVRLVKENPNLLVIRYRGTSYWIAKQPEDRKHFNDLVLDAAYKIAAQYEKVRPVPDYPGRTTNVTN